MRRILAAIDGWNSDHVVDFAIDLARETNSELFGQSGAPFPFHSYWSSSKGQ